MDKNDHFTTKGASSPAEQGRFIDVSAIEPMELVEGLQFWPVYGAKSLTNFVRFAPNTIAPPHMHAEEQVVLILEGELELEMNGKVRTMGLGDVAIVPSWVKHSARTRESGCYEVDFFSPPRQTLVDHATAQLEASIRQDVRTAQPEDAAE